MIHTGIQLLHTSDPCSATPCHLVLNMPLLGRLTPETCIFLLCDVQERFRPVIHKFDAVICRSNRLLMAANELRMPTLVTEQYPKGLGHTVSEIDVSNLAAHGGGVFEKTSFSMLSPGVQSHLAALGDKYTNFVVCGLEAHVCVQQTTLDLLEAGKSVHLCVDGISSSSHTDRAAGLRRSERAGAVLTTTEAVMMELIRTKDHPSFKTISSALKETKLSPDLALEWV